MILPLNELQNLLSKEVENEEWLKLKLNAIESMIVNKTNNNFIVQKSKLCTNVIFNNKSITAPSYNFESLGYKKDNQILVMHTNLNNGYYTVANVTKNTIELIEDVNNEECDCTIAKVEYPADIIVGTVKLIEYDLKMADKLGVKSETISRYSVTYYDVTSNESDEGYPSSLLGFLKKYRNLRW